MYTSSFLQHNQERPGNVLMAELLLMGKALDGATNCLRDKLQNIKS